MSGLDEQREYFKCPQCGKEPRGYYLSNKDKRFIGLYKATKTYTRGRGWVGDGVPKVELNTWYSQSSLVSKNPEVYIERARCTHCWTLFSLWRKGDVFKQILYRVNNIIRNKTHVYQRSFYRETEPDDNDGYYL